MMGDPRGVEDCRQIVASVVDHLDPVQLVEDALYLDDKRLQVRGVDQSIPVSGRLFIIGFGKASIPMAVGALNVVGSRCERATVVTKRGLESPAEPPAALTVLEADHPVPTEASIEAGARILDIVNDLNERDVVICLISGGGSALLEALPEDVSLDDLQHATDVLLRGGASINHLNAVRRRLSLTKGGKLAETIAPAKVVNLIISDVLGNPVHDIASGPTVVPDHDSQFLEEVISRRDWIDQLPESVRSRLETTDATSDQPEVLNLIGTVILADAEVAARAAAAMAEDLGYSVSTIGFDFQGEASEFGRFLSTYARHLQREKRNDLPIALVSSGELTVTVRGDGTGGRNTEMALSAAIELDGKNGVTVMSFATDGDDGLSGFAGGIVNGRTATTVREQSIDLIQSLRNNNTAPAIIVANAEIDLGPTGTNVNDVYLALIDVPE